MKDIKYIYIELGIEFTHSVELRVVLLSLCSYIDLQISQKLAEWDVVSRETLASAEEVTSVVNDVVMQDPYVKKINVAQEAAIRNIPCHQSIYRDMLQIWFEGLWKF